MTEDSAVPLFNSPAYLSSSSSGTFTSNGPLLSKRHSYDDISRQSYSIQFPLVNSDESFQGLSGNHYPPADPHALYPQPFSPSDSESGAAETTQSSGYSFLAHSPPPTLLRPARPMLRSTSSITVKRNRFWAWPGRKRNQSLPSCASPPLEAAAGAIENETSAHAPSIRSVRFQTPEDAPKAEHDVAEYIPSPHPQYRCRSISTGTLASLAWTGHSSSSSSPSLHPHSSNATSFILPLPGRPSSPSRSTAISRLSMDVKESPAYHHSRHRRRWTLAIAMTDDRVTDEALVEGLEKVRLAEQMWEWRFGCSPASPLPSIATQEASSHSNIDDHPISSCPAHKCPARSTSDPSSAQTWQIARRALLISREIIRTERNYLTSIRLLVNENTSTPPPTLMLTLLESLMTVSQAMLARMEQNPSALGVAEAFASCEPTLQSAFVDWCAKVGEFLTPSRESGGSNGSSSKSQNRSDIAGPFKRKLRSLKKFRSPSCLILPESIALGRPKSALSDIAILPTQRVSRYVLLYKELLRFTPHSSPSYHWVQTAVNAACNIAAQCDAAQDNSRFLK